jgi:predicted MFS family arabinose efflux permease
VPLGGTLTSDPPDEPASPDEATPPDEAGADVPPWAAFRFRDYRLLWLAALGSFATRQLRLLVSAVWLFEETGSAEQVGLLGAVQLVMQLPALLYGGTLADRLDRRRLMAAMEVVTFAVLAVLALLAVSDRLTPAHIYLGTAITAVSAVLGQPARNALTPMVVPRSHIVHAVTTNNVMQQVAAVIAPLLFAVVAEGIGLTAAFVTAAIVAAPSVALPLLIGAVGKPETPSAPRSVLAATWEGLRFVRGHALLPGIYALDIGVTVVTFYRQILPVLAFQLFAGGAGAVGLLTAANSVGAIAGGVLVLFLARYRAKGMLVLYASFVYGLLVLLFGLSTSLIAGTIVIAGLGAADAVTVTVRQATVQLTTPPQMLGRASSVQSAAAQTANNVGTLEVGLMSGAFGASTTMLVGGVLALASTFAIWRAVPAIRDYRYP